MAAATLSIGGVAAAAVWSAHTGRFPVDAEDLRLGGPGEKLDPSAPDYGSVIDEVTADIPFPSEEARELSRASQVRDGRRGEAPGSTAVSTGALRFWTARAAVCAWANEWAAATTHADAATKAHASTMLEQSPTWPAVTDLDPVQTIKPSPWTYIDPTTGRTVHGTQYDNTEAGYFPLVQKATYDNDLNALGAVLAQWGSCDPDLMPDFPQALPQG
ncbi:hypothetical protein [Nocardioides sp.]|uniref:hypothetical protein n=1 Tax=Nocardioides sp. TaxID=35761 RepID=UPI0039E35F02